ncbi:hypothetical protein SCOR_10110 [Sulfidibacter corallicola]
MQGRITPRANKVTLCNQFETKLNAFKSTINPRIELKLALPSALTSDFST